MWKKISHIISGKDCELRERMFRIIILASGIAAVAGILEGIILQESGSIYNLMLCLLLATVIIVFVATFKYQKYDLAATVLGVIIMVIFFPVTFFLNGGLESGAPIWFVLSTVYVFIMFSGKKFWFFIVLSILVHVETYRVAYYHPEFLQQIFSKQERYFDSLFSIFVVGCITGIILKGYMKDFEKEHKLSIHQREELEKNRDSKNILFANMSHEIRTPINAIIGLNEMILRTDSVDEIREYAEDIQSASKLLLNQVNEILDLSQMEMGKMNIVTMQYETKRLFWDLANMVRFQLEKKGLDFYIEVDKNLPSVLVGDEKRIKQVILNILDNAVKYTEEGSVTLSAQGELCDDHSLLLKVKVEDTGIGIRKEDLEYIYNSFNRFDEKKNRKIIGSGLGLAITKQLIDLMGGEITVDSIYRKGSVFTVTIKQEIADMNPIGPMKLFKTQVSEEIYRPVFEAPEARILIVDDNRTNSMVAKKLLSSTKVKMDIANDGMECLEMTKKKFYHIILLDDKMPDMDGPETLKAIRSQENGLCRDTAVIAMTGNTVSGARQLYTEQGFDGYVEKPIQSQLLEAEILQFLTKDIIEYMNEEKVDMESPEKIVTRKRKKICITTDCVCDMPAELLEKYDVTVMYLYVKTPYGRFADTREIDSDSLTQYISSGESSIHNDCVTVEEFEEFFSDMLTQAEQVIHISLASASGRTYETSVKAARGFDHVQVIDSGQISCGQGLLVLYAARLAQEGKSVQQICEETERMKAHIKTRFILPRADLFHAHGYMREISVKLCQYFHLHPYVTMYQNKPVVTGLLGGSMEKAWKQGIRWHLRRKRKISKQVVFITHAGCSVKEQEYIKKEVMKCVPFEKVIMQKASLSNASVSGIGAVGISYYNL